MILTCHLYTAGAMNYDIHLPKKCYLSFSHPCQNEFEGTWFSSDMRERCSPSGVTEGRREAATFHSELQNHRTNLNQQWSFTLFFFFCGGGIGVQNPIHIPIVSSLLFTVLVGRWRGMRPMALPPPSHSPCVF